MSNARNLANLLGTNTLIPSNKMFSGFANGTTELDTWQLTSDISLGSASQAVISSNLSRWGENWEKIGTGMSESSGVFTFPSTGKWKITAKLYFRATGTAYYHGMLIDVSTNSGSNYYLRSYAYQNANSDEYVDTTAFLFLDVTDASAFRVRFQYQTHSSGTVFGIPVTGTGAYVGTHFVFEKIADT